MNTTRMLLASAAAAMLGAGGCASSNPERGWGNGQAVDPSGQFASEVAFETVPLDHASDQEFRADELPTGQVQAMLVISPGGLEMAGAIDRADVRARITIRSAGPDWRDPLHLTHEGRLEGGWRRSFASWNATPLEYVGAVFVARRHQRYTISLQIDPGKGGALPAGSTATLLIRGGEALRETEGGAPSAGAEEASDDPRDIGDAL